MKDRKPKTPRVSEAQIEETCTQFLELDAWRCIKTDLKHLRGLGVQEPGMADRLYIRYHSKELGLTVPGALETRKRCFADVMHIEWKCKGGKAALHQKAWHHRERARGALTLIAGEDFPASIEEFQAWYRESGLMRKRLR